MAWIPSILISHRDPQILLDLSSGIADELSRAIGASRALRGRLLGEESRGNGAKVGVRVDAHGFDPAPAKGPAAGGIHHVRAHLVLERGESRDVSRRLLNEQLCAVSVLGEGDLRPGSELGEALGRFYPETQLVRAGELGDLRGLVAGIAAGLERFYADPDVAAFADAVAGQGLVYQSEAFGAVLCQVFRLAKRLGPGRSGRRGLACLLLDGESGTGKRGLAEVFHAASERRRSPMQLASCAAFGNESMLRSTLFGHRRGAYTDARDDRAGLVAAAGRGTLLLDDLHRLPSVCTSVLHSFLEDGEYARLGEEELRRRAEAVVVATVESGPWRERRQSGELPASFASRVERLSIAIPPLRERPEDIEAQARSIVRSVASEAMAEITLTDDAIRHLRNFPFAESNSRELRNAIEQAVERHYRETDRLEWSHLEPFLATSAGAEGLFPAVVPEAVRDEVAGVRAITPIPNSWQRRLRALAGSILAEGMGIGTETASSLVEELFDRTFPGIWDDLQSARRPEGLAAPIPMPVWEDLLRCFAVSWHGGPSPSDKELGIPANTLRQWINDREARARRKAGPPSSSEGADSASRLQA